MKIIVTTIIIKQYYFRNISIKCTIGKFLRRFFLSQAFDRYIMNKLLPFHMALNISKYNKYQENLFTYYREIKV